MPGDDTVETLLDLHFDVRLDDMQVAFPAQVVSYSAELGTVVIKPLLKYRIRDTSEVIQPGDILDVPVLMTRTSKTLDFAPLDSGDIGLAVCSDKSIADWKAGIGTANYPDSARRFDANDAYFIPGGYPLGKPWAGVLPSDARGISVLPGQGKLYFGHAVPLALNGGETDLVNMLLALVKIVNLGIIGVGVDFDHAKLTELELALADLKA